MKSTLIDTINERAIVKLEKAGHMEWLVCRDYDDSKPEGTKWSSAQYFYSLIDAVRYAAKEDDLYLIRIVSDTEYSDAFSTIVKGLANVFEYLDNYREMLLDEYSDRDSSIVEDITKGMEKLKEVDKIHVNGVVFISYSKYEPGDEIRL